MLDEQIRKEFNRWAEQGQSRGIERSNWEITRQMIGLMNPGHHDNILDLGCGVGLAVRVLAERASRGIVLGLDLSDRSIHQAQSRYRNPPNALFAVADASKIPCAPELFNALLSVESIYYYPNLEGAFLESFRILNPTGRAYFLINYYKENVHSHEWAKHLDIPLHLLGTKDYIGLLTLAGFRSVTDRRIVDTTPVPEDWKPTRWFPTLQDLTRFRAEGALLLTAEK